jgi:FG-GAP repeat protein
MRNLPALLFLPVLCALDAGAQPTPPAPIRIVGEAGDGFGWQVAPAGDIDGDGAVHLIVGAPANDALAGFAGRVYLFRAPLSGTSGPAAASHVISTPAFGDNLGFSVAPAGDINADGVADVLMGARGFDQPGIQSGRVYAFHGPIEESLAARAQVLVFGTAFEEIGRSVASAGDLNADGVDDVLVGTGIGGPADEGRVYVFRGPLVGRIGIDRAAATIVGALPDDALGAAVAPAGDLNGDGFGDIVVGAPRTIALGGTNGPGRVFVFHGPLSGTVPALAAEAVLTGGLVDDDFGISLAVGDVNGDGVTDLVVGADQIFRADGTGKAYVFHGPLRGSIAASQADAVLVGSGVGDLFGGSVATADIDGDGKDDVIVGAPGAALAAGRGYVFRGPLTGTIPAASAPFVVGGSASDELGRSVTAADLDGNGRPDAIFGAPAASSGGIGYVAAYTNALPPPADRGKETKPRR